MFLFSWWMSPNHKWILEITTVADGTSNFLFTNPVSDFIFPPEWNLLHPFLLKVIFKVWWCHNCYWLQAHQHPVEKCWRCSFHPKMLGCKKKQFYLNWTLTSQPFGHLHSFNWCDAQDPHPVGQDWACPAEQSQPCLLCKTSKTKLHRVAIIFQTWGSFTFKSNTVPVQLPASFPSLVTLCVLRR